MEDNFWQDEIDKTYEQIVRRLKGGRLYGIPMDESDMKWMVVSAYLLGEHGQRVQHMSERKVNNGW